MWDYAWLLYPLVSVGYTVVCAAYFMRSEKRGQPSALVRLSLGNGASTTLSRWTGFETPKLARIPSPHARRPSP